MQYLFWDFDNTLGYRDGMWSGTLHTILKHNGIHNIDLRDIRQFLSIGFTWHSPEIPHSLFLNGKTWWEYMNEYFAGVYQKLGIDKNQADEYALQVQDEYKNIKEWYIYDDVIPTLESAIKRNYKNLILSNHIPELKEIIQKLGIQDYFHQVYTSGEIGHEKPSLKFYNHVLDDLKIKKEECVMIGDSYDADIVGALQAGIKAILVRKPNDKNYKFYTKNLQNIFDLVIKI